MVGKIGATRRAADGGAGGFTGAGKRNRGGEYRGVQREGERKRERERERVREREREREREWWIPARSCRRRGCSGEPWWRRGAVNTFKKKICIDYIYIIFIVIIAPTIIIILMI